MAFEDFQNNTPVIILNDHTSLEDLLEDVTIVDGNEATPEVFNKNIRDSVNRDVNLEASITYLARSASLYTTNNTEFLSHCEGEGVDVISYLGPYTGESGVTASELFTTDDTFLGAAYPQGTVTNMIPKDTVYNKYPRKNTNGWTMDLSGWVEGTNVIVTEDSENNNLIVSTLGITGSVSPGVIKFKTAKMPLTYDDEGVATVPEIISGGFTLKTGNLITASTSIKLTITLYDSMSSSASIIKGGVYETTLSGLAEFNDVLSLENLEIPAAAKALGSPAFDITVTLSFNSNSTPITINLSKFMVQEGQVLYSWTETSRSAAYLQYGTDGTSTRSHTGFVDIENNDAVTLSFWSKFSSFIITRAYNPIGPVFLSWKGSTDEMSIGLVHKKEDGENLKLRLAINKNGTTTYSTSVLDASGFFNTYVYCAYRLRKEMDTATSAINIILEASIALDGKITTISITLPKTSFPIYSEGTLSYIRPAVVVLGKDISLDSSMTSSTDIFTSKISEIRYDTEWINNLELYLASLGRKPFSYKQSTDSQITTKSKSTTEIIDNAGINLVENPTGRFALIGWTEYNTGTNFSVAHTDRYMGNCFKYIGSPSSNVIIYSKPISIAASTLYSLRAFMMTRQNDTGEVGIGVRFSSSSTFDPTASIESDALAICSHTGKAAYYSVQRVSPSSALYATVYMYAKAGASVSAQWSKIKLEQGDPTFFTEDCGPNYAIYY